MSSSHPLVELEVNRLWGVLELGISFSLVASHDTLCRITPGWSTCLQDCRLVNLVSFLPGVPNCQDFVCLMEEMDVRSWRPQLDLQEGQNRFELVLQRLVRLRVRRQCVASSNRWTLRA